MATPQPRFAFGSIRFSPLVLVALGLSLSCELFAPPLRIAPEPPPPEALRAGRRGPPPELAFREMWAAWDRRTVPAKPLADAALEAAFVQAEVNARLAAEAFFRSHRFVTGWLAHADERTGLIPRNLERDRYLWNPKDSAADNYPFMVLTTAMTDRGLFEGAMRKILESEIRLTSRVDRLPDDYLFSERRFANPEPDINRILFGASEYVKDGLMPLTEWLGPSPWSERMVGLLEDIMKHAAVETPFGRIPSEGTELNGEMLQALSRAYWMTGQDKFLDWAIRIGDYYLLGDNHPTRTAQPLRMRDHGCEVVGGLSELYFAVHHKRPAKKAEYRQPLYEMYDTILEKGRNEHGLFYDWFNPITGEHTDRLADTWGYNLNGFYTVYLLDGHRPYRDAVLKAFSSLNEHYRNYAWEGISADGYADSIESAINLFNREPDAAAMAWADSEIKVMWAKQHEDGVIEGWHGDGNFARTTLMYGLWKTEGLTVQPWREDVRIGAVRSGDRVHVSLSADRPWKGRVLFDRPRHREHLRMPLDYPRINQIPEWFVVEAQGSYGILDHGSGRVSRHAGSMLAGGIEVELAPGEEVRWTVAPD